MDCESPSAVQQHRLLQMKLQQQQQPWMTMNMVELPHSSASQGGGGGDRHSSVHVDSTAASSFPPAQPVAGHYVSGGLLQPLVDAAPPPINVLGGVPGYQPLPASSYVVSSSGGLYNPPPPPQAVSGYDVMSGQGFVGAPVMGTQIRTNAAAAAQQAGQAQQQRASDDSPMMGVCVQQSPTVATH
jgi:hypothetical protein